MKFRLGQQQSRNSRTKHGNRRYEGARMILAAASSSYPVLSIFWTILEVFLVVIWFWILITVFIDIFRSPDLSGGAKALWFLFVLFIPLIGVLFYLIFRGGTMNERSVW
jgi:hypothetical protein